MRRELKELGLGSNVVGTDCGHKAYPDEKGTERILISMPMSLSRSHKAYPDEKGTERVRHTKIPQLTIQGHKAYPDEKGTES